MYENLRMYKYPLSRTQRIHHRHRPGRHFHIVLQPGRDCSSYYADVGGGVSRDSSLSYFILITYRYGFFSFLHSSDSLLDSLPSDIYHDILIYHGTQHTVRIIIMSIPLMTGILSHFSLSLFYFS